MHPEQGENDISTGHLSTISKAFYSKFENFELYDFFMLESVEKM
jgi:hypothetical protein